MIEKRREGGEWPISTNYYKANIGTDLARATPEGLFMSSTKIYP